MTIAPDVLAELDAALPHGCLLTDPDLLASYSHDWARDPDAVLPAAVARPTRTEEVQAVLRWAGRHRVPVIPAGPVRVSAEVPPRYGTASSSVPSECAESTSTPSPVSPLPSPAC